MKNNEIDQGICVFGFLKMQGWFSKPSSSSSACASFWLPYPDCSISSPGGWQNLSFKFACPGFLPIVANLEIILNYKL